MQRHTQIDIWQRSLRQRLPPFMVFTLYTNRRNKHRLCRIYCTQQHRASHRMATSITQRNRRASAASDRCWSATPVQWTMKQPRESPTIQALPRSQSTLRSDTITYKTSSRMARSTHITYHRRNSKQTHSRSLYLKLHTHSTFEGYA